MERIMVIGCSGSGKTTLSVALGEKLGLPVVHLDVLNWRRGWTSIPRAEFDLLLDAEINKPRWIIDGDYSRTVEQRLGRCDTVVYLDFSRVKCLLGVLRRSAKWYGRTRPDMGEGCTERFDPGFWRYVWSFNACNRERYYGLLGSLEGKQVFILKNRRQVRSFLQSLPERSKTHV